MQHLQTVAFQLNVTIVGTQIVFATDDAIGVHNSLEGKL